MRSEAKKTGMGRGESLLSFLPAQIVIWEGQLELFYKAKTMT
jgi:hypothetical protein